MDLYLGGAETPTHRKALSAAGVTNLAVNFTHLRDRLPKKGLNWDTTFGDASVLLYATVSDEMGASEQKALSDQYGAFLAEWWQRLTLAVEADTVFAERARGEIIRSQAGAVFAPLWDGFSDLDELCSTASWVAVTDDALTHNQLARPRLQRAAQDHGCKIVALGVSKPETLAQLRPDAAASSSWLSVSRFGETQVWDGVKLHRYHADQKSTARSKIRQTVRNAGLDETKVMDDDKAELTALALWSWKQLGEALDGRSAGGVVQPEGNDDPPNVDRVPTPVDQPDPRGGTSLVIKRDPVPIPVAGFTTVDDPDHEGPGEAKQVLLGSSHETLRKCDSCFIQANCPGFQAHHSCAYSIPVEVRTKGQLQALLRSMIEIQTHRVLFARMAEELDGGFPSETTSTELDRLLRVVEKVKGINDTRDFVQITAEARGNAGVLSRVFGAHVGDAAKALPAPGLDDLATNLAMTDIIEGELVD